MKLYLGLLESSRPDQTRIFTEIDGRLIDVNLAYAAYLQQSPNNPASAYELADFYFPGTIAAFLERGEPARKALAEVMAFARCAGGDLRGPGAEKISYAVTEVKILPPLLDPKKSFVIGFSDVARTEALPKAEIPTGYYKLPQTFVSSGAPIVWPKFPRKLTPTPVWPSSSVSREGEFRSKELGIMSQEQR